jgi:hypothetical protein
MEQYQATQEESISFENKNIHDLYQYPFIALARIVYSIIKKQQEKFTLEQAKLLAVISSMLQQQFENKGLLYAMGQLAMTDPKKGIIYKTAALFYNYFYKDYQAEPLITYSNKRSSQLRSRSSSYSASPSKDNVITKSRSFSLTKLAVTNVKGVSLRDDIAELIKQKLRDEEISKQLSFLDFLIMNEEISEDNVLFESLIWTIANYSVDAGSVLNLSFLIKSEDTTLEELKAIYNLYCEKFNYLVLAKDDSKKPMIKIKGLAGESLSILTQSIETADSLLDSDYTFYHKLKSTLAILISRYKEVFDKLSENTTQSKFVLENEEKDRPVKLALSRLQSAIHYCKQPYIILKLINSTVRKFAQVPEEGEEKKYNYIINDLKQLLTGFYVHQHYMNTLTIVTENFNKLKLRQDINTFFKKLPNWIDSGERELVLLFFDLKCAIKDQYPPECIIGIIQKLIHADLGKSKIELDIKSALARIYNYYCDKFIYKFEPIIFDTPALPVYHFNLNIIDDIKELNTIEVKLASVPHYELQIWCDQLLQAYKIKAEGTANAAPQFNINQNIITCMHGDTSAYLFSLQIEKTDNETTVKLQVNESENVVPYLSLLEKTLTLLDYQHNEITQLLQHYEILDVIDADDLRMTDEVKPTLNYA